MMRAIVVRARAEIRDRWRALVALALVIGLGGGFVIAAATGARRTDSVYKRFLAATHAADVEVIDDNSDVATPIPIDKVEQLPQVEATGRYLSNYINIGGEDFAFVAPADDRFGVTIDRVRIVSGRAPIAANEAVVSLFLAQRHHVGLGYEIPFFSDQALDFLRQRGGSPQQIQAVKDFHLRVVGIEAGPGELPPQQIGNIAVHLSPTFLPTITRSLSSLVGERLSLAVRLRDPRATGAFVGALQRLAGTGIIFSGTQQQLGAGTKRSFHLQAIAFWILASLVSAVILLIFSQSLARNAVLESGDSPILRALGMGRAQLFAVGMARALVIGLVGAAVAAIIGYALTPLTPLGLARTIEPHRGLLMDGVVLAIGGAAVLGSVLLLSIAPAWKAARVERQHEQASRPSRIAGGLAAAGSPATLVSGAQLAFQRGRGRTAVPVRSSLAGATIGVAALVAALVFGSSLIHLTRSPSLYGWRWDFAATSYGENDYGPLAAQIGAVSGVGDYTLGSTGVALRIDGIAVQAIVVGEHRGDALPPVVEGRGPLAPNEIVLGTKALRELHKHIGDTVSVALSFSEGAGASFPGVSPETMRIVGRGVFPPAVDQELGRGAMATFDNFPDLPKEVKVQDELLIRFVPGSNHPRVIADIKKALAPASRPQIGLVFSESPLQTPADLLSFGQARNLPLILAGLLGVLAAATLAHTLISSIHRRARDLALLKTLGFVRGQVRAVVAWQSLFLALATIAVGIPAGVFIGRWAWNLFADRVGVVPVARVPLLAVSLVVPSTFVLANLLGVLPARSAARTQAAIVLRTE
jgi:ABC-type lipoprotein release transport system permease subunit